MKNIQVLIVGGGCAGYTAGIYTGRANLDSVLFEGMLRGGQLSTSSDVENYPGFPESIDGSWLTEQMRAQAERCGTKIIGDSVTKITQSDNQRFIVETDSSGLFCAIAVIIATGADANWLGLESETQYRNKGVSACATCDGFFFKGKDVAVVGGGNVALSEAIFLANIANSVTLIHRRNEFRGEKKLVEMVLHHKKIRIILSHTVDEFLGDNDKLCGLRLKGEGGMQNIEVDGAFIAVGHTPNSKVVSELVDLDKYGYIKTVPNSTKTRTPGLFAAGDVQDGTYRQAATSVGSGCMAALDAERYITETEGTE